MRGLPEWQTVAEPGAVRDGGASGDRPAPPSLRPYAYVLGGVLLGGLSPVFTKLLLWQDIDGPTIVAARYLLTVAFLAPFGLPHRRPRESPPPDRRAWITLFLVGALGSGLGALLFTAAVDLASAGVVNAISKTAPIFVALFAYFTLRERVTYLRMLLVAVMVGADVLIAAGEFTFTGALVHERLLGDLLALGAGMTRAAAEILGKSALQRFTPSTVALWRFGVGLLVAGTVSMGTGGYASLAATGLRGWILLLALAGVSTALYMVLYYRGLAEIPAHVAVSLKLLGAIVTVVVSWFVLGEELTPYHIAGICVLISGAYLLVMRAAQPADEPAPSLVISRPWTRLRPRIVGLVVLLAIASVGVVWYLSVRHSVQLIRQQVHLTVGEVAAILVEFGGLEERPSWQSYEQYLQRVVGHRVEGDLYALEVVYVAALDPRGNIGAFAISPDLEIVTDGSAQPVRDREAMRALLAEMDRNAGRHGIITARAELVSDGRTVGSLRLGARREMTSGMVGEIVGRSAVAAMTVLLLAAAIASVAIGGIVEPIERLALELGGRSRGDDGAQAPMDEVEQIRRALSVVGQAVGVERATIATLSLALAEQSLRERPSEACEAHGGAWLRVKAGEGRADPATLATVIEVVAREAARQDGIFRGVQEGAVCAQWGCEADDALRAALAALALRDELRGRALAQPVTILVGVDKDHDERPVWWSARQQDISVLIGRRAARDAGQHLRIEGLEDAGRYGLLVGLAEPPGLEQVAEDPED